MSHVSSVCATTTTFVVNLVKQNLERNTNLNFDPEASFITFMHIECLFGMCSASYTKTSSGILVHKTPKIQNFRISIFLQKLLRFLPPLARTALPADLLCTHIRASKRGRLSTWLSCYLLCMTSVIDLLLLLPLLLSSSPLLRRCSKWPPTYRRLRLQLRLPCCLLHCCLWMPPHAGLENGNGKP